MNQKKPQKKLFVFLVIILFSCFILVSGVDTSQNSNVVGVNIIPPITTITNNTIGTVNASELWITTEGILNDVSDILHSDLSNLAWSVAGHIIDTDLDIRPNNFFAGIIVATTIGIGGTTYGDGIISSTSGEISFGDENLTTTGNVSAANIFTNKIYDTTGILSIDVTNRLFDVGGVLSADWNDRKLYANGGTDVILDWYNSGLADFKNTNINTTGNITCGTDNNGLIIGSDVGSPMMTGDTSGGPSRTIFKPTAPNLISNMIFVPSGTQDQTSIQIRNTKELDNNFGRLRYMIDGALAYLVSDRTGIGTGITNMYIGEKDADADLEIIKFTKGNLVSFLELNMTDNLAHFQTNEIRTAGQITNNIDNSKHVWGSGHDASAYYDGTDLIINPKEVGSGKLVVLGGINVSENAEIGGKLIIGGGLYQTNITLTSPNSAKWCCGVNNSGAFSCSAGAC